MTFKEELEKILHLHAEYYQSGEEGSLPLASATQAITELVIELVGEDEELPERFKPEYPDGTTNEIMWHENQLRAELKSKLKEDK